jgi:hypothetical protein
VAVEFLTQSGLPLLEVAACVGFSEASTCHGAFKGWTGLTLGVYRQAHNEPAEDEALARDGLQLDATTLPVTSAFAGGIVNKSEGKPCKTRLTRPQSPEITKFET